MALSEARGRVSFINRILYSVLVKNGHRSRMPCLPISVRLMLRG